MSALVDGARAPRAGEELDVPALEAYLVRALPEQIAAPLVVEQFPSGHSNLTYLLRAAKPGGGDVELVLRRPPFGNVVKTAHDMGREHTILAGLSQVWNKAPRPLVHCQDESILGVPFCVMERRRGVILRRKMPPGLAFDADMSARLGESFVQTLVELHEIDYAAIGLGSLGKPEGYVERQVPGWTKRYDAAKTDDIPEVERAAAWLAGNIPASPPATLIHNDFKYDNMVLDPADPTRVTAVLDWEMSTVGDPLMDLGTALAWWVEAKDPAPLQEFAFGPTNLPGSPTRLQIAEAYAKARPHVSLEHMRFYYAFSLFKNAVVAQQIYARYKKGLTKDERFAMMIFGVRLLSEAAVRAIETGEL
jgi:aminoglycoside phosphotransferase (APT) family kinase protein